MSETKAIPDRRFLKICVSLLPNRLKRLLLLTSLAAIAKNIRDTDKSTIHLINEMLHLAVRDSALYMPIRVKSYIWNRYDIIEPCVTALMNGQCGDKAGRDFADSILRSVPQWFGYGSDDKMRDDILNLFKITEHNDEQTPVMV